MNNLSNNIKYIDIHTHNRNSKNETVGIENIFIQDVENIKIEINKGYSIGLHPWHITEKFSNLIKKLKETAKLEQVIAIGEIGLDRKITTPIGIQKDIFIQQASIAVDQNKPIIIHCVRAYSDLLEIIKSANYKVPFVIHGFSSNLQTAIQLINHGSYLSFGRNMFSDNQKLSDVLRNIPIDKVFLETDESDYTISDIYKKAEDILAIDEVELINKIKNNFKKCFRI